MPRAVFEKADFRKAQKDQSKNRSGILLWIRLSSPGLICGIQSRFSSVFVSLSFSGWGYPFHAVT